VRGRSTITDYHVLVTATSAPHIKALAGDLEHQLKAAGTPCYRRSGSPAAGWVVIDYVDVVTHIFAAEMRRYYDLETLWGTPPPPPPARRAPARTRTRRRKAPPS
jgi:ribosome-associated protein